MVNVRRLLAQSNVNADNKIDVYPMLVILKLAQKHALVSGGGLRN
jgi:hypothetical protein